MWLLFLLYQISESFAMSKRDSAPMFDVFLAHKALNQGKRIYSIESPEEQCDPLTSVSEEQVSNWKRITTRILGDFRHQLHFILFGVYVETESGQEFEQHRRITANPNEYGGSNQEV